MSEDSGNPVLEELDRALADARRVERAERDGRLERDRRTADRLAQTLTNRPLNTKDKLR